MVVCDDSDTLKNEGKCNIFIEEIFEIFVSREKRKNKAHTTIKVVRNGRAWQLGMKEKVIHYQMGTYI